MIKVPAARNPYLAARRCSLAVGVETTDTITITGRVAGAAQRIALHGWFSRDAHGDVPANNVVMPAGGYAIGTNGTLIDGPLAKNRLTTAATLAIDATPEKFKLITTTAAYTANGVAATKAPATAIVFSAAHVVSANRFGIVLVQINAAGTVSTKCPGATQTTPMAYTTAALALAALPETDAGTVALGYIAIDALTSTAWTANTDDLTNASDVDSATFVNAPANGQYPPSFTVLTETDGTFDIVVSDTRAGVTSYLNVRMPDGTVQTSGAITFA